MTDSLLNTSIATLRTELLAAIPTATASELMNIARSAKGLGLSEDTSIETAINSRANTLTNTATSEDIIKISGAVKQMLTPAGASGGGGGGSVDLTAVSTNIIPDTDITYDLGSTTHKFKDLYLDGSTLNLGNQTIKATATGIEVPELKIGTGTNTVKLTVASDGKLTTTETDSSGNTSSPAAAGGGSSVTVSDTAPTSPSAGDQWFDSSSLIMFVYYADGSSNQWIPATPAGQTGATGAAGADGNDGNDGTAGYATVVTDMAGLIAITGMVAGQTALVTALNKVFMYTGSAWYLIATMTNASPTAITGVNATYDLAIDGTATTITAISTDPEGFPLTWSYAVTTGSLGSTATVSQADNVFTITPSTTEADAGTFSITFSVTDGATGAVNAVSAFTLVFTPPLPTSGLLGLYDMNDTNSYSGSGTSWNDVSGNSGPTFTIDTNFTSYINSSNGIGGIPALALDGANANQSNPYKIVYHSGTGLTNSSSPYASTAILIFAHREIRHYAGAYGQQTWYYLMSKPGPSYAIKAEQSNDPSLLVGTGNTGTWSGDKGAASSGSKLYIDKVDATTYTQQQVYDALSDTNNKDKYHSIVLTDGLFYGGFSLNEINPNLWNAYMKGDLRAMVFYDRPLTSAEVADVHDHFAGDYTSSEMIQ